MLNTLYWLSIVNRFQIHTLILIQILISIRFQIHTLDQKLHKSPSLCLWSHLTPYRRPVVQPQLPSICTSNMSSFWPQGKLTCSLFLLHLSFHRFTHLWLLFIFPDSTHIWVSQKRLYKHSTKVICSPLQSSSTP